VLFRETQNALIAISQPAHAWLSGQIMRAWGNARFGPVLPYEEVCLGAEQHDMGWLVWEQSPTLNPATGRPHSFRELNVATHTGIWNAGTAMALVLGRYPALLVSLHGTGLYANFETTPASEADRVVVRHFLDNQHAIQRRLIDSLRQDERLGQFATQDTIERNRRLVRAADRMSIAICSGLRDPMICSGGAGIVTKVPTASGDVDLRLSAVDGDVTTITVSPWPFGAATVELTCEGTLLPSGSFADETDMRTALAEAECVTLSTELRPA
jgi:hypothetical protein